MRIIPLLSMLLTASTPSHAEIPEWYIRDIGAHLSSAYAVVLYRVDRVILHSNTHNHFSYRFDTTTLKTLKGEAPAGDCYFVQSEEERDFSRQLGETRLVILNRRYESQCARIEPGYSAPGTAEYLDLFRAVLRDEA